MKIGISKKIIVIIISVGIASLLFLSNPFGVSSLGNKVIAIGVLMISLWVTEALPMPIVALLPLFLFPAFNIASIDDTAPSYANKVIFLFMGGFMLGLAIEKWNLHKRIALNIVRITGTSGDKIVLGFIIATGFISMWLSNTSTTMMMFPIAMSVIHVITESNQNQKGVANFSLAVMLSIALASNFGGIATLIGTPPNVAYAAFINQKYNYTISFVNWMMICLPLSALLMYSLYLVMVKWLYPNEMKKDEGTKALIANEVNKLGKMTLAEKRVLMIFSGTAFLWITKDVINNFNFIKLDDSMIAIMGAVALFVFPAKKDSGETLLEWNDTKNMAWGILLLFGGGIALASGLEKAGLISELGQWFAHFSFGLFTLILVVSFISLFISEVMSNIAQVILFAPVVSSLAEASHVNPLLLGIPMTLAASCASMLPMGTPPNAIAFSSGHIKIKQMMRVGLIMNVISVLLITFFCWLLLPLVFK